MHTLNSWGQWILYAIIASIITIIITGVGYYLTEKKQFIACVGMVLNRRKRKC